ncbi:MAG: type II toxin-antitoxin system VapC family toxin [Blautia sp.]|nr:type II toxin-antitoxin system VapC family toxin [Lachnoclostridium sp.]MCM1211190.1 type II toxin-antitoxin system VapC family toxin [Blautia sp.]
MRILVDTHIAMWSVFDTEQLPEKAHDILSDSENEFFYSTASVWEIAIKAIARPDLGIADGEVFAKCCEMAGFRELPLNKRHVFALKTLKLSEDAPKHKDPFDRILICQAKIENMKFLTHDSLIPYYKEPCIISV